jgi:hypothetical protein
LFFESSGAGQVGGLAEQGPAEVDVVEEHERFRVEAFVFDLVFDRDAWFPELGPDAAAKDQVRAEYAGLPDLATRLENAPFVIPERVVGDPGCGDVRRAAVQAELFAAAFARRPDISQATGDE